MMKVLQLIYWIGFVATLSTWSFAGDVFVNNLSGDDAHDGTCVEQAVQTLKRGVQLCAAGDTLHLAKTERDYRESLVLGARGGTPFAPIIVEGNGAVLSGLMELPAEEWQERGNDLYLFPNTMQKRRSAARPYVIMNGEMLPQRKTAAEVAPEEYCWESDGIYFRVASGKKITDYKIEGTLRGSGLVLSGGSYIEVRNLICERFANDGFNIHGSCQGLVFRNIVGRWNGDDGFSIHEDVGAVVLGGHFHHNDYGIQDVNLSRSSFYGVLVEDNRRAGADFNGGAHTLIDCVIRNNAGPQIQLRQNHVKHMRATMGPMTEGLLILKNTLTIGGDYGVAVRMGRADISHCTFVGAKVGALIGPDAQVELVGSAFYGCENQELISHSATTTLDANLYAPGRMGWQEKSYEPVDFAAYQEASGQDGGSIAVETPTLVKGGGFQITSQGLLYGKHHIQPGIQREFTFPFGACGAPVLGERFRFGR